MQEDLLDDHQQTSLRFYYDLKPTRNITLIAVAVTGILILVRLFFLFRLGSMMGSNDFVYADFMWTANLVDQIEIISAALLLLSIIPFMMWVYRAYFNLDHVKQKGLNVTPGWAVGWFFIPFANLYYDVLVLNDIFKGTKHLSIGGAPSQSMERTPIPPIALLWFLAYIIGGVFENIGDRMVERGTVDSLNSGLNMLVIAEVLSLLSGVFLFYYVFWVSKKQVEITSNGVTA